MRARPWWLVGLAIGIVGCSETAPEVSTAPNFDHFGNPWEGHFVVCKTGSDATFDIVVDGTSSTLTLADGECQTVAEVELIPGEPSPYITVSVTEIVPPGTQVVRMTVDSILVDGTTFTYDVTGTNSISRTFRDDVGYRVTFENGPVPMMGRMTGGGVVRLDGYVNGELVEVKFTKGFTLHCDIKLSNNLEVNWGGNQWHIEKESLEHVNCIDDPDVSPEPPAAPFDTFIAAATGRLNGEWGSHISFILQDAGEPGGKNDKAGLAIWDVGVDPHSGAAPIIVVPFDYTVNGNIQAHYDQPHK